MPWDPEAYHRFQAERFAPFNDLLALVNVREGLRVIDLGCGTGELTRRLADHLLGSDVLGIDASPEMLERAAKQARPGLRFQHGRIESVEGEWDLVFSNAALHWVDDHSSLIPRLLGRVRPGGQLVVQVPSNDGHPSHALAVELAQEEPFCSALHGWVRRTPVLSIAAYAELLHTHGGTAIMVFEKVYPHLLPDADALADWTSGSYLIPYSERLPQELHDPFMREYRQRLRALWPSGPVFYGFRRTLLAATRPSP